MLTKELPVLKGLLEDDNGKISFDKFIPNDEYYYHLLAYLIINSIKNTNKIYNTFSLKSGINKKTKSKNKRQIPKNWKVIQGGKK